jgi:hypothetical protein
VALGEVGADGCGAQARQRQTQGAGGCTGVICAGEERGLEGSYKIKLSNVFYGDLNMTEQKSVLEKALEDFKRSVEITRDVRFQANLRLARRQKMSSYMIALLSLYVIALSLLPNILELNAQQSQILLACSIVLSVFVIFTSLIDGAQNFYHQGELLHQCARKVASVYHELKNLDPANDVEGTKQKLEKLQTDYRSALDECPINHENIDFIREQAYKPHLFEQNYKWEWKAPKIFWNKAYAAVGAHSWMALHAIAIVTITVIVYRFILTA